MRSKYAKDLLSRSPTGTLKYGQRVVQSKKRKVNRMVSASVDEILNETMDFLALEAVFNAMAYYHGNVEGYWSDEKWDKHVTNLVANRKYLSPELRVLFDRVAEYPNPTMRFLTLDEYKQLLEDW